MSAHHPASLVSCQWLKEEIERGLPDDVVICDVSWSPTIDMKIEYNRYTYKKYYGVMYQEHFVK